MPTRAGSLAVAAVACLAGAPFAHAEDTSAAPGAAPPGAGAPAQPAGQPAQQAPPGPQRPALDGSLSLVGLARHVLPSVLMVEVSAPGRPRETRHAVVVDADGWLVMAGPTLGPSDQVVVRLGPGEHMQAAPVGSDAGTGLTLLQLAARREGLRPLALPAVEPRRPLPAGPEVGASVVMVTGAGAVARGSLRALERQRVIVDAAHGTTERATGLLEAALASVAHDVGSPWVDSQGRCVALLVGGVAETPLDGESPPEGIEVRMEPVAAHGVPAAVVALVWPLLREHRGVPRSRLGVRSRPAGEALRQHVCGGCGGVEITAVDASGPADLAGVRVDDLLLALDGVPLRAGAALGDALLPYRPLDTVRLTVLRRGERLEVEALLARR